MKPLQILRAASLLALALAAPAAWAEEDGVAMKSLLGAMGIIPKERPVIEYRERPGLVVPQKYELRPPADPGRVEARAANWPKDPDVLARQREAAEARLIPTERTSRLSPDQIQAGRSAGASAPRAGRIDRQADYSVMSPDQLRAQDPRLPSTGKQDLAYGVEPERRSLTDPPTGYRKPASNAPLKASVDAPADPNPDSPDGYRREMERRR